MVRSGSPCALLVALGIPANGQTLAPAPAIATTGPVVRTSMTLVWGAVPDATHYRIRLDDATGQRLDG